MLYRMRRMLVLWMLSDDFRFPVIPLLGASFAFSLRRCSDIDRLVAMHDSLSDDSHYYPDHGWFNTRRRL
jgi:hypothetical protein